MSDHATAGLEAMPSVRKILEYELLSSWWMSWVGIGWMQNVAGSYLAWKTKRKYNRYKSAVETLARINRSL